MNSLNANANTVSENSADCKGFDSFDSLLAEMNNAGLYPDAVIPDGNVHRFHADNGKRGKNTNGWYVAHCVSDKFQVCIYGNWAAGETHKWTSKKKMDASEKAAFSTAFKIAKEKNKQHLRALQEKARKKAAFIWENAKPAATHEYCKRKGISITGEVRLWKKLIVIPLYDFDNNLWSLQFISEKPKEKKKFLKNGKKQGCYFCIPGSRDIIYFAEGYATAVSVHLATKGTVIVCFDSGNIEHVLSEFRKKEPDLTAVICADNDAFTKLPDGRYYNVGVHKAKEAAQKHKAKIAIPDFLRENEKHTDFNDLHTAEGLSTVAAQIAGAKDVVRFEQTDLGNAERFAWRAGHNIRYSHKMGKWFVWENGKWKADDDGSIYRKAFFISKEIAGEVRKDAEKAATSKAMDSLISKAEKMESESRINSMISLTKNLPGISINPEDMDRDKFLFNVKNGVIDLRTGRLMPHDRALNQTKQSPVEYDSSAQCPLWMKFLEKIQKGDRDIISFLQRLMGYCLTGDTSEEIFAIFYGTGGNGKSKFIGAMQALFADYAKSTPFQTFSDSTKDNVRNDLAALKGARFVTASESDRRVRLAESVIKQSTGNDPITARFLYGEYFDYRPEFKILLISNYKPAITGQDNGIWRRVVFVPFDVTISHSEKDKNLAEKLEKELPGILKWAVDGCLAWQKNGLNPPEKIFDATNEYRAEMDFLSEFFDDCCCLGGNRKEPVGELYRAYTAWADGRNEKPVKMRTFNAMMTERGFTQGRQGNIGRFWQGICGGSDKSSDKVTNEKQFVTSEPVENYNDIPKSDKVTNFPRNLSSFGNEKMEKDNTLNPNLEKYRETSVTLSLLEKNKTNSDEYRVTNCETNCHFVTSFVTSGIKVDENHAPCFSCRGTSFWHDPEGKIWKCARCSPPGGLAN